MSERLEIGHKEVLKFKEELEEIIPTHTDGTECEWGLMVNVIYVPNSIKIDYVEPTNDPITPYYTGWTYLVEHSQIKGETFVPTTYISGFVEIPIGSDGTLILDDIDFLEQLTPRKENYALSE